MAKQGPIHTPVDYMCGSGSSKPSGNQIVNGVPGMPARSAHPMGVDEVTFCSTPGAQPNTSGSVIAPVTPPIKNL